MLEKPRVVEVFPSLEKTDGGCFAGEGAQKWCGKTDTRLMIVAKNETFAARKIAEGETTPA